MKNIDCSVVIGISAEAAHGTDEGRLVFAASTVHGSAARTRLRCKSWVYLHDLMRLVKQHRFDLVPTHVKDGAVQAALLSDVLARVLHSSGSTGGHVPGAQSLDNHSSVISADGGCRLVRPVLADTGSFCLECRNAPASKGVTVRSPLATCKDALCLACPSLNDVEPFRQHVNCAVRKHERHGNPPVNADRAVCSEVLNVTVLTPDADLPAERRKADGGFRYLSGRVARHAKAHPSYLRHADTAPTDVQALNNDLTSVEGEGIVHAFLLRLRIAAKALKEAAVSIIQRLERVLLAGLADGADKVHLAAKRRQFSRLRHIVEVVTRSRLIVPPVGAALLKSKIPHKTTHTRELREGFFLQGGRLEPVCEATKRHTINLIWKSGSVKSKAAFLPGLNAGVSSDNLR